MNKTAYIWTEKYRPQTLDEVILPVRIKKQFDAYKQEGNCPNILLVGSPGIGKTAIAKSLFNDLGFQTTFINASLYGNIDTLRSEIKDFVSSYSLVGDKKFVILDEADGLNAGTTQPALRSFIETYAANAGFCLTANVANKIIEPLRSRFTEINFDISQKDLHEIAKELLKRIEFILQQENIEYDVKVVGKAILKHFPDVRKIISHLQNYSIMNGRIDSGLLVFKEYDFEHVINYLKTKNMRELSKWSLLNIGTSNTIFFEKFYDEVSKLVSDETIPDLADICGEFMYREAFVANPAINITAMFANIIGRCNFK